MPVLVNLKSYLTDLERDENIKSQEQRREIPTLAELADIVGMHRISFYRIANNQVKKLDLKTADKIISEMRRRGFSMQISDLLVYRD
jgi:DNA-binding Xre family transcriptional regulator